MPISDNDEIFAPKSLVQVLLLLPINKLYDYRLGEGQMARKGSYVKVSFGRQKKYGIIWGKGGTDANNKIDASKIKEIEEVIDLPPLPKSNRDFIKRVADYTLSPLGSVLKMAIPITAAFDPPKKPPRYLKSNQAWPADFKETTARRAIYEAAHHSKAMTVKELSKAAGCGTSVVKPMVINGLLAIAKTYEGVGQHLPNPYHEGFTLSSDQEKAGQSLRNAIKQGGYKGILLEGVTGSGKTEVYFEAIAETLAAGKEILVLLPEIALSAQWYQRFKARFGAPPTEWHSSLTMAQRRNSWRAIAKGQIKVVVGARSALFLPYDNLGLIIVDEEHDSSFKQEEGVIYNARDMAIMRGFIEKIPVILASATPSLETENNAAEGRYDFLHLPKRHGGASLPDVSLIDLREEKPERGMWLAPSLVKAIEDNLKENQQSLLFLNRRGYAPLTLCRTCGHRLACPNCTAWLVDHRMEGKLICHHCGYAGPPPPKCPQCEDKNSFAACGPGVERITEEAKLRFPEARILLLASDTTTKTSDLHQMIDQIRDHKWDIIIGTQILAKGHNFPMLTLVGVVDADLGLQGGDLRAGERSFQLLQQVSGRAGRAQHKGHVYIQTHMPEHPVMQALANNDRAQYIELEKKERKLQQMPPFGKLAALIISSIDEKLLEETCNQLARNAPILENTLILGPAPAPLAKLRGRYRQRFLIRSAKSVNIQKTIKDWLSIVKIKQKVKIQIDIDPYSFM